EHLGTPEATDPPAAMRAAERMGRIEEQRETMVSSERLERLDRAGPAPQVDANDGRRARRDHALDGARADVVGLWIDVAEDRPDAKPLERMCRRDECKGRNENVPRESQSLSDELQSHRPIADGEAVSHPQIVRELRLELSHQRAIVGQPSPSQT